MSSDRISGLAAFFCTARPHHLEGLGAGVPPNFSIGNKERERGREPAAARGLGRASNIQMERFKGVWIRSIWAHFGGQRPSAFTGFRSGIMHH